MKLVFVAFDSVSHQPKSTNMISMTQKNDFTIDSIYIDDVNTLNKIYDEFKPNVLWKKYNDKIFNELSEKK